MVEIGDVISDQFLHRGLYLERCRDVMNSVTGTSVLAGPYDFPRRRWCGACKRSIDSTAWVVGPCPYCGDATDKLAKDPLS